MQLTLFSDYALRVLIYLGVHRDRLVTVPEIARAYRISHNHLVKVARLLTQLELVEAVRGRGGGMRLAREPEQINIGQVVQRTEPHFHLVECFDREHDTCPITPACKLKNVLADAQRAFMEHLEGYTLADFVTSKPHRERLIQLWKA